jgi:hypothetical protein
VLVFEIVSFISAYFQYDLLRVSSIGGEISPDTITANETSEIVVGLLSAITYIISAITFIQWFRRAYYNLHLKVNFLNYTEGWAAGCWFVPFINLYRPYQIMKELYEETDELLSKKGISVNQTFSTTLLGWWWAFWIINNFVGQFVFRYSLKAESIDELTTSTIASMIGNLLGIPLALIAIKVIKDYSTVEPLLNEIKDEEETKTV